ncbi:MAG: hypothetical protein WA269_05425 [Candidatus Udaeobacter sp.]
MSTVQEILTAMDKLTPDELRILKLGVDSRPADDDDDPDLHAALHEAITYASAHPEESKSLDEVRALIPKWISESKSVTRHFLSLLSFSIFLLAFPATAYHRSGVTQSCYPP